MKSALRLAIVAGFLLIDALLFHDVLKPGEHFTAVEYMTGVASLATIALLSADLLADFRAQLAGGR